MKLNDFFAQNKVFAFKELELSFYGKKVPSIKSSTLHNLLAYHQKQGHILHIRRGLYYSIPKGIAIKMNLKK